MAFDLDVPDTLAGILPLAADGEDDTGEPDIEQWGADPGGPGYRRRPYDFPYRPEWGPPFPTYQEIAHDDDGCRCPPGRG